MFPVCTHSYLLSTLRFTGGRRKLGKQECEYDGEVYRDRQICKPFFPNIDLLT